MKCIFLAELIASYILHNYIKKRKSKEIYLKAFIMFINESMTLYFSIKLRNVILN